MGEPRPEIIPRRAYDWPTLLAISVVVYVLAKVLHEGVGHGLVCELVGGNLRGFSSSWCDCDKGQVSEWGNRALKAAGTFANLVVGAVFLLALKRGLFRSGASYYFAWLSAAVHLFMGGGYMMVDPLFRFGDWGKFIEGLEPNVAWRLGIAAVGLGVSLGTFFMLHGPFERLLGGTDSPRKLQARILCWAPYSLVGGAVMTGAALLNSLGPKYAFTSALATLGGTFMLVWIPAGVEPRSEVAQDERLEIRRSRGWLIAGGVAVVFLVVFLGPGISL